MLKTTDRVKGRRRVNNRVIRWQNIRDNLYKFLFNHALCIAHIFENADDLSTDLINRDNELFLPLFSIATYIDNYIDNPHDKILPVIQSFASETVEEEEQLDDWSEWVIEALDDIIDEHRQYLVKDIKRQIVANRIDDDPVDDRMTNKWIGGCLRKFGLKRGKPSREGKTYWISKKQVEELKQRYYPQFYGHNGNEGHNSYEETQSTLDLDTD